MKTLTKRTHLDSQDNAEELDPFEEAKSNPASQSQGSDCDSNDPDN
jgi:hypothetical protein